METNTVSVEELNAVIRTVLNSPPGLHISDAKVWKRVDVNGVETYVGDTSYIITFNEKISSDVKEATHYGISLEKTVKKYLKSEGFIEEGLVVYVGLQRVSVQNPPIYGD